MKLFLFNLLQAARHINRHKGGMFIVMCIIAMALTAFAISASTLWHETHEESHLPDYKDIYCVQVARPTDVIRPYEYRLFLQSYFYRCDSLPYRIFDNIPPDAKVGYLCRHYGIIVTELEEAYGESGDFVSVNSEYFETIQHNIIYGREPRDESEIIITDTAAVNIFGTCDVVGNTVTARESYTKNPPYGATKAFTICGIIRSGKGSCHESKYKYFILRKSLSENPIQSISTPNRVQSTEIYIRTKQPAEVQKALDETVVALHNTGERAYADITAIKLVPLRMSNLMSKYGSFWKAAFYSAVLTILSALILLSAIFSYLAMLNNSAASRWTDHRLRISMGGGITDALHRLHAEVFLVFMGIGIFAFSFFGAIWSMYLDTIKVINYNMIQWVVGSVLLLMLFTMLMCVIPVALQNYRHRKAQSGAPQGRLSLANFPLAIAQIAVSTLLLFLVWQGGRQIHYACNDSLGIDITDVYTIQAPLFEIHEKMATPEVAREIASYATAVERCIHSTKIFLRRGRTSGPLSDLIVNYITINDDVMSFFRIKPQLFRQEDAPYTLKPGEAFISSNLAKALEITPENTIIKRAYGGDLKVVGTLDLCTRDLRQEPELVVYTTKEDNLPSGESILFRSLPGRNKEAIEAAKEVLAKHGLPAEENNIEIVNFGKQVAESYKEEQEYLNIYSALSGVGFAIAVFGMLTLIAADLRQQRRTIAIRRIFGASYRNCMTRTLRTYLPLTATGVAIGLTAGYYMMGLWLDSYSDHISLGWIPASAIAAKLLLLVSALVAYMVRTCFRESPAHVINS